MGLNHVFKTFNLSILECKYYSSLFDLAPQLPFNLSILECKFQTVLCRCFIVNTFNLSILECKFFCLSLDYSYIILLISPYWNVNKN